MRDLNPGRKAREVAHEDLVSEVAGLLSGNAGRRCNNGNPLSFSDRGFLGRQGEAVG